MTNKIFADEMLNDDMLDAVTGGAFIYYMPAVQNNKQGFIAVKTNAPLASKAQFANVLQNGEVTQTVDGAGGVHISIQKNNAFVAPEQVQAYVAAHQAAGDRFVDFNTLP